jgi:hypothetical protein
MSARQNSRSLVARGSDRREVPSQPEQPHRPRSARRVASRANRILRTGDAQNHVAAPRDATNGRAVLFEIPAHVEDQVDVR